MVDCIGRIVPFVMLAIAYVPSVSAQVAAPENAANRTDHMSVEHFEREVRPILVEHCQACHGVKKQEMSLRLDSAEGLRKGSDSGAVVVAGQPDKSRLIDVVHYDGDIKMPPKGKLPAKAIASLEKWIKLGAVWPQEVAAPNKPRAGVSIEDAKNHWAFQPITSPAIPSVKAKDRVATSIDSLILQKLEAVGMSLSPEADRRTLIRRATFDLHGLPPTPDEVAAFENDPAPDAFKTVIERLLSSPRYGERWGRHWLDVARYSDTKGYVRLNENPRYPASWTYRDYVIRSFNDDLPFDRFVMEQMAADLMQGVDAKVGLDQRRIAAPTHQAAQSQRSGGPALEASLSHPTTQGFKSNLAALGFLTLGQRFLNSPPDIIDDRIDVVTRGLLGLTVSCARCHDHKFDPVPTRDYYGLYGVFANSVEPRVPPLILEEAQRPNFDAYLKELAARTKQLDEYLLTQHTALTKTMRGRVGEYLLAGQFDPVQPNFLAVMFLIDASKDLNPVMTQRWARYLEQSRKRHDPVLAPWNELVQAAKQSEAFRRGSPDPAKTPDRRSPLPTTDHTGKGVEGDLRSTVSAGSGEPRRAGADAPRVNRLVVEALSKSPPQSLAEASQIYGRLLTEAGQRWEQLINETPSATKLDDPEWEELRLLLMGPASPLTFAVEDVEEFLFVDATTQQQLHAKQRLVTDWIGTAEAAPHAMALEDARHLTETRVYIRGNASNPGEVVPRQFLAALTRGERQLFQQGSGRLELAQAIASADNPLTARVLVNRIWQHHFGAGLVRTPSDFGLRGERPSHPELLDHLASRFIARGWSIKQLHREIMLSSTYRQSASNEANKNVRHGSPDPADTPDRRSPLLSTVGAQDKGDLRSTVSAGSGDPRRTIDPENKLLGAMPRRRLDWEALRDSLLAVSGQIDFKMGGPSVDLFAPPFTPRRSVYGLVDRQNLPSELRTFDFAPPDASAPQRHQTTVPQQALFLMNGPFLKQTVKRLAARPDLEQISSLDKRIDAVFRLLFARPARADEIQAALMYLSVSSEQPQADATRYLSPLEEYLQVLLLSNEFVFVD